MTVVSSAMPCSVFPAADASETVLPATHLPNYMVTKPLTATLAEIISVDIK
jgi:hypothetical protein